MSKIVIDAREWSTSTGRYIRNLVLNLEKIDSENGYTVLLKPKDMGAWEPASPNFHKLACPYKEFTFSEQLGYRRQLNGLKADLVHFGMVQQPILYNGRAVTTIHDLTTARFTNPDKNLLVFRFKQQVYKHVIKRVASKSVAVITASRYVKDDLSAYAGIDLSKITVIYEAAKPITEAAQTMESLEGKQFLMYVGRPTPHKNLERLVEVFGQLKSQHPDLLLVLAGRRDANYQRIERLVEKQAIPDVIFTGYVSEGQLRWLYENTAAYVFPSLSEGFGLPGLEAMTHGAPLISSNAACLPEVYGEAARYFDPLDTTAMATAINEVLTDAKLRQDLVAKGQKQAAKYSWQRTAEQTLAVYKKALGK